MGVYISGLEYCDLVGRDTVIRISEDYGEARVGVFRVVYDKGGIAAEKQIKSDVRIGLSAVIVPHGRLIDEKALLDNMTNINCELAEMDGNIHCHLEDVYATAYKTPTVIETED